MEPSEWLDFFSGFIITKMSHCFFPQHSKNGKNLPPELRTPPSSLEDRWAQPEGWVVSQVETEADTVTVASICSDPVTMLLFSLCALTLAKTTYFIKGSELQGRASLEAGSFLYHLKSPRSVPQSPSQQHQGAAIAKGVGGKKQGETQCLCSRKKQTFFFSLKDDDDLS